jgi:uncharacterized protein (UPF0303 family)
MSPMSYSISDLEQEELTLVLESFTEEDAWLVGSSLAARALREAWPVAIDIRRPASPLFRAAFSGSTADQSAWIDRKAATAFRFQASSLLVGMRMGSTDNDPFTSGWLGPARYTLAGGSVPIRVKGAGVVAALTVSGLSSEEDHAVAVDALREHRSGPPGPA